MSGLLEEISYFICVEVEERKGQFSGFPCPGKGADFHGMYLVLSCLIILPLFFYTCSYLLEFYHFYHDITDILYKFKVYM